MATAQEVQQQLVEWYNEQHPDSTVDSFEKAWTYDIRDLLGWSRGEIEIPAGTAKFVEEFGGEGLGDTVWVVFQIGEQFYQVHGSYASWDGESWYYAEVIEVEPEIVSVVRYKRKKLL